MHILHHDFGGYPFQAELSRALAERGHRVTHAYCASLVTTPGGTFARQPGDPDGLAFAPIDLGEPLAKYDFAKRWRQERRYGRLAADLADRLRPDAVLSGNTPLDAQARLLTASRRRGAPFVFWLQDVIGVASHRLLRKKIPVLGEVVGRYYLALEARLLRRSDAVVAITEDFEPLLRSWGVAPDRTAVIENWAPLSAMPVRPKDSAWAREQGLHDRFVFLYSGTLGMKHNPELLAQLAEAFRDRPEVRVVVVSQGPGAEYLRAQREARRLSALEVRDYEPLERVPDVMGAADVLVAVLEPDAGAFSVPSKVLSYLCAGRPLLLAVPPENLAARIVTREGAGLVVGPDDADGFVASARRLLDAPETRERMGASARRYAEAAFDIGAITDRFEAVLTRAAER
ncbi:MAG: glycosyltransferase family 4 protein [Rubricoccaceae bacterium]|nr:glycosyltransferase family 4 protein [Rubricoccaceae bacterium]